ncbi:MAG TPA: hypothetical protein VM118_13960 [Acidobacteriota bacterium]|nr:hypothetical protein [Acidobacteriota bacterium]
MARTRRYLAVSLIGLVSAAMLIQCAAGTKTAKIPIFADPGLFTLNIRTVTLLPVIDQRIDKSHGINLEADIGNKVEKELIKKRLTVIRAGAFSDTLDISNDEVAEMEPRELAILGSSETQYMLVVYLNDASGKTALGYSFKIETTAILLNRQAANMLWKDKGVGSQGQGGLYGCLISGMVRGDAIRGCVAGMLASFPPAPFEGR